MLRYDANPNKIILAVSKAVVAKFDRGMWIELGMLTDTRDVIEGHGRLLRSLYWGDDDYTANVFDVIPEVLGQRAIPGVPLAFQHFYTVEKYVGLPQWLRDHEPELYAELYGNQADDVTTDDLQAAAAELGLRDVDEYAARIRRGLPDDPALAIGSAKELLETVFKAILGLHGTGKETKLDLPVLAKKTNVALGLDDEGSRSDEPGAAQRRRTLKGLNLLVDSIGELRNLGFGTGHGLSQRPELHVATARLVVSSAVAAATFYIEAHAAVEKNP